MSAHTPGPWHIRTEHGSVGTDSQMVAMAYGDDPDCKPDDTKRANARLIAAAPALLEALESLHDRLLKCSRDAISASEAYDSFYQDVVASAIAAAKGE